MSDRIPLPFPQEWFCVADSDALAPGEIATLRAFGQDLAAFPGEDGRARGFDPFGPHLGAHLGVGGAVVGSPFRCPFHHWRFDA